MIDRHVKEYLERDRNRQSWTSVLHVKAKEELGDLDLNSFSLKDEELEPMFLDYQRRAIDARREARYSGLKLPVPSFFASKLSLYTAASKARMPRLFNITPRLSTFTQLCGVHFLAGLDLHLGQCRF